MTFKKDNGYKFNCLFMNMSLKIHTRNYKDNENAKNRKKILKAVGGKQERISG